LTEDKNLNLENEPFKAGGAQGVGASAVVNKFKVRSKGVFVWMV
jgi:hypothetical protein